MENVTGKCEECGDEMQGRTDRKFCSSACRQKAYRSKRNVTTRRHVTAEPFLLSEGEPPYKFADQFWQSIREVPGSLGLLGMYREGADPQEFGLDEPEVVAVTPPRRKGKELAEQDIQRWKLSTLEFLEEHDEMVRNLASMKATAELIVKHNGWE